MKKIKKHFVVSWQIYPFDVLVSIGESHAELVKVLTKKGQVLGEKDKEILWMEGRGRTVMFDGGQTVIRLGKTDPATIVHEVFHAVAFLFDRIKIKLSHDSDEAFAYAIEYLTKEIYKRLK
jgi:hypothetical protein